MTAWSGKPSLKATAAMIVAFWAWSVDSLKVPEPESAGTRQPAGVVGAARRPG